MTGRETEYEQLLVYFLYRHFLTAYEDGDPGGKAAFAVLSTRLLRRLGALRWQRTGQFSLEDQAEYARLYSSEVEYSQENLDAHCHQYSTSPVKTSLASPVRVTRSSV